MSGIKMSPSTLTGTFNGSPSTSTIEPSTQSGIERTKTNTKNVRGDLLDDVSVFMIASLFFHISLNSPSPLRPPFQTYTALMSLGPTRLLRLQP